MIIPLRLSLLSMPLPRAAAVTNAFVAFFSFDCKFSHQHLATTLMLLAFPYIPRQSVAVLLVISAVEEIETEGRVIRRTNAALSRHSVHYRNSSSISRIRKLYGVRGSNDKVKCRFFYSFLFIFHFFSVLLIPPASMVQALTLVGSFID